MKVLTNKNYYELQLTTTLCLGNLFTQNRSYTFVSPLNITLSQYLLAMFEKSPKDLTVLGRSTTVFQFLNVLQVLSVMSKYPLQSS